MTEPIKRDEVSKCDHYIGFEFGVPMEGGDLVSVSEYAMYKNVPHIVFIFCPICGQRLKEILK